MSPAASPPASPTALEFALRAHDHRLRHQRHLAALAVQEQQSLEVRAAAAAFAMLGVRSVARNLGFTPEDAAIP